MVRFIARRNPWEACGAPESRRAVEKERAFSVAVGLTLATGFRFDGAAFFVFLMPVRAVGCAGKEAASASLRK